jgi:RecB family exonuclease
LRAPEFWDLEGEDKKSRWGNRIHLLLSKISTREETPEVLEAAIMSGLILPDEKEQLEKIFGTLFAIPFLERLFSDDVKVLTEAEILLPDGDFFRPDRVVVDGEDTFIIDYKTGRPNERHKSQLNRYSGLLAEMGYKNITRVLIYLESKPVIMKF